MNELRRHMGEEDAWRAHAEERKTHEREVSKRHTAEFITEMRAREIADISKIAIFLELTTITPHDQLSWRERRKRRPGRYGQTPGNKVEYKHIPYKDETGKVKKGWTVNTSDEFPDTYIVTEDNETFKTSAVYPYVNPAKRNLAKGRPFAIVSAQLESGELVVEERYPFGDSSGLAALASAIRKHESRARNACGR